MAKIYEPPILTVDSVIFQLIDNVLSVLLIQRAREPFEGQWALPGGYNAAGETTHEAMKRIIKDKSGVKVSELGAVEQLYTFDTVARDPRGHAVSVTYMGLGRKIKLYMSKTTENPTFFAVDNLPKLAYDHETIIKYAHKRLCSKITYTNAICFLLPEQFTLTQLQSAYEAILGRKLDKRNFRKKILALGLIEPTNKYYQEGAHRPAKLYSFKEKNLEELTRTLD